MRLNKYVAHHSKYSRREADRLIQEGKVKINGKLTTNPAVDVNEEEDKVQLYNTYLKKPESSTVIVYHKDKAELVTKKDDRGRKTIYHALPTRLRHFMPVGRLDYASEGLLILSDSQEIVDTLMRSDLPRVYRIKIQGDITPSIIEGMKQGVTVVGNKGGHELSPIGSMDIKPFINFEIIKNQPDYSILKVSILEGKNRELRRFFAHYDKEVVDLTRYSYGWIALNNLKKGKWRYLEKEEYKLLHQYMKKVQSDKKKAELKEKESKAASKS